MESKSNFKCKFCHDYFNFVFESTYTFEWEKPFEHEGQKGSFDECTAHTETVHEGKE